MLARGRARRVRRGRRRPVTPSGRHAESALGATVHLLDDGFQHLPLARDLDIVVTPAGALAEDRVLPMGRLREPLDALRRASVLVVVGAGDAAARPRRRATASDGRRCQADGLGEAQPMRSGVPPAGAPVVAVAGIGQPRQFVDGLAGRRLAGRRTPCRSPITTGSRCSDLAAIAATVARTRRLGRADDRQGRRAARAARRRCRARSRGCRWRSRSPRWDRLTRRGGGRRLPATAPARPPGGRRVKASGSGSSWPGGARRPRRWSGLLPAAIARGLGVASAPRSTCSTRPTGGWRWPTWRSAFRPAPTASAARIARRMFQHFGVLLLELLRFSALSRRGDARAVEIEGEDRVRRGLRQGQGVLFFTGHFGFWELHAIVHALRLRADRRARAAARQPGLHDAARAVASAHRQHRDLPRRAPCARCSDAGGRPRRGAADRSAHAQPRRDLGATSSSGRRPPPRRSPRWRCAPARRSCRCLRCRCRGAAIRFVYERPVEPPTAERPRRCASSPSAAPTCSRCTSAASRSCGCGCTGGGAMRPRPNHAGMFPAARDRRSAPMPDGRSGVVVARAQLARRCGDGAAGHCGPARLRTRGAHLTVAARPRRGGALSRWCPRSTPSSRLSRARRPSAVAAWQADAATAGGGAVRYRRCCCPNSFCSAWIGVAGGHPGAMGLPTTGAAGC